MGSKLMRHAYERLIAEDLEWLERQPHSLERDHIRVVLECSADLHYPSSLAHAADDVAGEEDAPIREDGGPCGSGPGDHPHGRIHAKSRCALPDRW